MKILQILYPGIGGHTSVAFSLIEGDIDATYNHLLLGYGIENPSKGLIQKCATDEIPLYSVKKKAGLDFASWKQVHRYLTEIQPNVILMHSTSLILPVWWYALTHPVSFISIEHQSNYAKSKSDWVYTLLIQQFSPKIVYLSKTYSEEIKQKLKFFFHNKKVSIIENGVNSLRFNKALKVNDASNVIHISMVSRMNKLRDHGTLLKGFKRFSQTRDCKLWIAGSGDTFAEVKAMSEELSITDKVNFLGNITEDEVITLLSKTTIYVHSSLAETQSTSILQAMSFELPIIATHIPGIVNILDDGEDALLFEPKNEEDLLNKLILISSKDSIRNKIASNAYKKVMEHYNCKRMFAKYQNLISK
ncbi:MAG: glycosyltransferase family 4 protein [Flavobacteriaceae bacterium]